MDETEDSESLEELGSQILEALNSESVTVKLQNGTTVEGTFASFAIRKKAKKKGDASLSGRLSVETESGVLEMDCANIASVTGH